MSFKEVAVASVEEVVIQSILGVWVKVKLWVCRKKNWFNWEK